MGATKMIEIDCRICANCHKENKRCLLFGDNPEEAIEKCAANGFESYKKLELAKEKNGMNDERMKYLEQKRTEVLGCIKPMCEAFGLTDYDYIVKDRAQTETLRIGNDYIGCSFNSLDAIRDELIGWLFTRIFCRNRYIGAFEVQTLNVVKEHWLGKDALSNNGFLGYSKED